MSSWFWYAVAAAMLYGLHQIFTKLASAHVTDGLGGLIVEGTATVSIALYMLVLWQTAAGAQRAALPGIVYSILTGICVGAGTVMFFLLFQKGGPLSAVPMVLAGGAALMAVAGILFFKEPASWPRLVGILLSIAGLYMLRLSPTK
jgi:transporter family protein